MSLNKNIDFSNIKVEKVFLKMTNQYKTLQSLDETTWKDYTRKMIKEGIKVKYDVQLDAYIATPIKENKMADKKYLLQDDDMDMEQDALELINSIDVNDEQPANQNTAIAPAGDPTAPKEIQPSSTAPVSQPSIDLSQFEALLNKILGGGSSTNGSVQDNPAVVPAPAQQNLQPGQFTNNVLNTEFDANADNISYIDSKIDSGSYMAQIDPKFGARQQGVEVAPSYSANDEEELNEYENSEMEYYGDKSGQLKEDPHGNNEYEYYGEKTGQLTEEDDVEENDDEVDITDDDSEMSYDATAVQDTQKPITANGMANVGGQPVKIILTGVMISPSEVSFVAESAKKAGMKLKSVIGKGKVVNFVLESGSKQYTIKYEDLPKNRSKTPFSIKQYTFTSLDEALDKIRLKKKNAIKEASNFKKFMTDDISKRSFSDIKESNILKEFQGKISKDYIPAWNVKAVGIVNLKNGLNEVYSNVTEHSEEKNTLVKTKDGQFFMIKGNLKERSAIGIKRQLVDLQGNKDYGIGTVEGIYENSIKGLGEIMYKTKRTNLPLLAWK